MMQLVKIGRYWIDPSKVVSVGFHRKEQSPYGQEKYINPRVIVHVLGSNTAYTEYTTDEEAEAAARQFAVEVNAARRQEVWERRADIERQNQTAKVPARVPEGTP